MLLGTNLLRDGKAVSFMKGKWEWPKHSGFLWDVQQGLAGRSSSPGEQNLCAVLSCPGTQQSLAGSVVGADTRVLLDSQCSHRLLFDPKLPVPGNLTFLFAFVGVSGSLL